MPDTLLDAFINIDHNIRATLDAGDTVISVGSRYFCFAIASCFSTNFDGRFSKNRYVTKSPEQIFPYYKENHETMKENNFVPIA